MRVWRLAKAAHKALDGEGARLYGGRWNSPGRPMVYASASLSLAVLETLVHLDLMPGELPADFVSIEIDVPDDLERAVVTAEAAAARRHDDIGDEWLEAGRTAILAVPSVVVPIESNLLLNPIHADFRRIETVAVTAFSFDSRLFG